MTSPAQPKHANYGPSSMKYRAICPGWASDKYSDTTYADEGTMLHTASETGETEKLNEEQRDCVQKCLNYIRPLEQDPNTLEVHKEIRLNILNGLTFGTADRVIVRRVLPSNKRHADLIDFKYGRGVIDDAETNLQGWSYLLGVFDQFSVQTVTAHFLIPRRDEVLKHTFTRGDLPRIETTIRSIIERCEKYRLTQDQALLNPTEVGCQYCGNLNCPVRNKYAVQVAAKYAPLELVADEVHSSQVTDPVYMAKLVTVAKIMDRWAGSVMTHAKKMVEEGAEIPGFEMRERTGARKINNATLAYPVLRTFLEPEEIVSAASISLPQIEKLVSAKAERGEKTAAMKELNLALSNAECVTCEQPIRYLQRIRE